MVDPQDTACAVCPKKAADRKRGAKDSAFFRAAKPTENRGWVHVLCATFVSHLEYSDGRRMRLVEGISAIPKREWTHVRRLIALHYLKLTLSRLASAVKAARAVLLGANSACLYSIQCALGTMATGLVLSLYPYVKLCA
jgi:hypothetical protein